MKTILVVDDVVDNRDLMRQFLEDDFEILEAEDGKEAVEVATSSLPDLILMDLSLPRMTGWEATSVLKQADKTKHIVVIALTAHALDGDRERAIKAGCDDYLTKPVTRKELITAIQARIGT